ncbi:MAG: hypothetical protein INR68_05220 [Methylobacterium mesophilicum]|nr:hypothetical protein [Methylobacterium mesophilicum]
MNRFFCWAKAVLDALLQSGLAEVDYVAFSADYAAPDLGAYRGPVLTDLDEAMRRRVDLVIEAAVPPFLPASRPPR